MTCLTLNSQADDALKVATIDMQELFKEYHRTNAAQKQINVERAKVQKENNERLARIRELDAELQNMRKQLDDPSISSSRKQTVYREWQMKQNEGVALNRERSEFMQRRNRAMNEQMVQRMKGIGRGAPPGRPLIGRWAWAVA
ncbi:OmpH family outer membrane protein [Haloferula sp.]|uniref:OmpH family outer membrane protein n=1 Tax=Haloferula sp. TaxID=2497595 RepID=UPI00329CBF5E